MPGGVRGGKPRGYPLLDCAPGMVRILGVKVPYGPKWSEPLAEGKGVIVRWGLEEAGGKIWN
jgi:hypothetical protein